MRRLNEIRRRLREALPRRVQTLFYRHALADLSVLPAGAGVSIGELTSADVDRLASVGFIERGDALGRLARGDRCFGGFLDGKLAHYSWVQRSGSHRVNSSGEVYDVEAGELWVYHCVTAPWGRGRHIYPCVLNHLLIAHRDQAYKLAWIYTTSDNDSSQRGIVRAGFKPDRTLDRLMLGKYPLSRGSLRVQR